MIFLQSSQDILTIVKAFAILWIAIFVGWLIYYMAMTAREGYLIVRGVREKVNKVDAILDSLKEKIDHSASYLLLIGEGVKKLIEIASKYAGDQKKKRK